MLHNLIRSFLVAGLLTLAAASAYGEQAHEGVGSDGIFRITPQRPIPELRAEALALQPPAESGQFRSVELVDLTKLDPTIKLDIRYATTNNFLSTRVYTRAAAYLQRPAAEALVRVHHALAKQGYSLLIHDAYRPWWVTKVFWEATPPQLHEFVADPAQGSRHNRGCAVDLTLYDLRTGEAVSMPSVYDEMSPRAYPDYAGGTPAEREHREILRRAMEREGFTVYKTEWWHFDFKDWREYPIVNREFANARPVRLDDIAGTYQVPGTRCSTMLAEGLAPCDPPIPDCLAIRKESDNSAWIDFDSVQTNGHQCGARGIARLVDDALLFCPDGEDYRGQCVRIEVTGDELVLKRDGKVAGRDAFCGTRATVAGMIFPRKAHTRVIQACN